VTNSMFISNSANSGGGMFNDSTNPEVFGCIFLGNSVSGNGGGIFYNYSSNATLSNCTFSGNLADYYGGAIIVGGSGLTVTNCILWENTALLAGNEILTGGTSLNVDYSDVKGGLAGVYDLSGDSIINWGIGNIDTDPLFADPNGVDGIIGTEDDNFRLSVGLPCIDDANDIYVPAGVTTDLDGWDRIVDGDCDLTATVDMGAYEFDWRYLGDFDGECDVDLVDFAIFALAWLAEEGEGEYNPVCDISIPADDTIDMLDAEIVFRNWLAGVE
jgi:parallel beta-helix repeat protein